MKRLLIAAAMTAIAGAALAQVGTGFTISDGDVFFTQGDSVTVGTGAGATGANFRVNGAAGTDHMFQNWFWYRTDADTREVAFNNASGTTSGGNTATTNFSFQLFNASVEYTVTDTGADAGILTVRTTVTNTQTFSQDINIFNYMDLDMGGSTANNATGGIGGMTINAPSAPTWDAHYTGTGADEFQVTAFATLRTQLSNTTVEDFDNTGLPFGPADWTGGYQWRLDLAAGASFVVESNLVITNVPEPGTFLAIGAGVALLALRRRRK